MQHAAKLKTAKLLAGAVAAAGLLVMAGWVLNIGALKSVSEAWTTMKFITAFCFVLSGAVLYLVAKCSEGDFDSVQAPLSVVSLLLLLSMGTLFFSGLLGAHTGMEDLFVSETPGAVKTVVPGRPSLATSLSFMLIAAAGLLAMLEPARSRRWLRLPGWLVAAIGAAALAGYAADAPLLYYFVPGVSTAMAFNTAALLVLLGAGFLCLSD